MHSVEAVGSRYDCARTRPPAGEFVRVFFEDGRCGYAYWTQSCWWSSRGMVRPAYWEPLHSTTAVCHRTGLFTTASGVAEN
jgi:hypothetical protein